MDPESQHYRNLFIGIGYVLITWVLFSFYTAFAKSIGSRASLPVVMFLQYCVGVAFLLPWFFKHGFGLLKVERKGLVVLRVLVGLSGTVAMYLASIYTSIVDAILLSNAAPIFLPFIALIWLKQPIEHKLWPGIAFGFLGILCILKPGKEIFNPGAFYGIANGVCIAMSMILMRTLSKTERNHTILLYFFGAGALVFFPLALISWHLDSWSVLALILLLGASAILGQLSNHRSFYYAKPIYLAPFCYSGVIFSALIEWIWWGAIPDLFTFIGILLICMGGVFTIVFSNRQQV